MTLTFRFFRDQNGRLRCSCEEFGITKPVERADGKRYKFAKVFHCWEKPFNLISDEDLLRLQTAQEGDVIRITL